MQHGNNLRVLCTAVHVLIICALKDGLGVMKLNDIYLSGVSRQFSICH